MNVLKTSNTEINTKEMYKLTRNALAVKMSDVEGETIAPVTWVHYEDENSDGVTMELLSISDGKNVYTTNSATFIREFLVIADMFSNEDFPDIIVCGGQTKNDRHFITCTVA